MPKYTPQEKENFSYKYINDPVYGSIGLSKLETDLINTPAFQRLRHLKQLGFASYVFPGGEHSRFVHSLGVLYIMGRMCLQLESNEKSTSKGTQLFSPKDTVTLRVAALLHDIGHYPLSHLGEFVYQYEGKNRKSSKTKSVWEKDPTVKSDDNDDDIFSDNPVLFDISIPLTTAQRKAAHHELLGQIVITHNTEILNILEAADLDPELIGDIFSRGALSLENTIYYNLLHSSLDADRLDYLIRDSAQTGVKFGMVDLDYLIRLIMIKQVPFSDAPDHKARIVVYNKKGQHVIEHFLMCRYFHYAQVVNHRTSGAFEMMAKVLFYKIIQSEEFIVNSSKALFEKQGENWFVNTPDFLQFTDEEWWHTASKVYKHTDDILYKTLYEAIQKRKPAKTLYFDRDIFSYSKHLTFTSDEKEQYFIRKRAIEKRLPDIALSIGLDPERIGCCFGFSDIEKDAHNIQSNSLTVDNEEMMDCIKIALPTDEESKCTILAKDETSMIAQVADLYTESINVFYVPNIDEEIDVEKFSVLLREALDQ